MKAIDNYEGFCEAFESKNSEIKERAELLLFIQNWIIQNLKFINEDTLDYSIKKLIEDNTLKAENTEEMEDALSNIVDKSDMAFKRLTLGMREKIIRENVKMPVHKVREMNTYSLNWLSRQSGKTIRQKISSAGNSIFAVQRRMSFDTAENRLLIAFAKEMYDLLNIKSGCVPDSIQREKEKDFTGELMTFLCRDDIEEVRRWENLPPNNTLLSDQNYKKIWSGWNELKKIDERIKNNSEHLSERLATIFFIELLILLNRVLIIPQEPVELDYDEYKLHLCNEDIYALDRDGDQVELHKDNTFIEFKSKKKNIVLDFIEDRIIIHVPDSLPVERKITLENIHQTVEEIITLFELEEITNSQIPEKTQKFKNVVIDLFSLYPGFIGDDGEHKKLSRRILQQKYTGEGIDGVEKTYYIPCDSTNAIKMGENTEEYTIPFAVDNASMDQMKRLMYMVENHISTKDLVYVFPDAYNDIQLSMVHKVARMVYHNVKNIPLSIGAAFKYQERENFSENFNPEEFLLVVNIIDDELTLTLVRGNSGGQLKIGNEKYKGMVWERHPTSTKKMTYPISAGLIKPLTKLGCKNAEELYKLLTLDGLSNEIDNLSILYDDGDWFQIKSEVKEIIDGFKIDITKYVLKFIKDNEAIIGDKKVHILSIVENLIFTEDLPYSYMERKEVLDGCKNLENLEKTADKPLWHDYLPALAIKLLYGKFDLIKNAKVVPKFGEKQRIAIDGTFTLPKDCDEYHFNLVQDENARKMQYEAVIRNLAFPLKEDVECELQMTYQYGTENPYELIFIPKHSENKVFSEARVQWTKMQIYSIDQLKTPEFPEKRPWSIFSRYPGKNNDTIDVFETLEKNFMILNQGFYIVNTSDAYINYYRQRGSLGLRINDAEANVEWYSNDLEEGFKLDANTQYIAFWVIPKLDNYADDRNSRKRYYIPDLMAAKTRNNLWFQNSRGGYQCIVNFEYEGAMNTISIIDSNFDMPHRFNLGINNISFEVGKSNNGQLQAYNIHNEDEKDLPTYRATNICDGGSVPEPPRYFVNSFYSKWIRSLFANNRSVSEPGCPEEFRNIFMTISDKFLNLFNQYKDTWSKKNVLSMLSLMAEDIGPDYYKLVNDLLDSYSENKDYIPYEVGCALCDLSTQAQQELLSNILTKIDDTSVIIAMLAKGLWHNENLVYKIDNKILLDELLPEAIGYVRRYSARLKKKRASENELIPVKYCLEFILGILRLRSLGNEKLTRDYLSLNNHKMQSLYKYLENMIDYKVVLHSFLKLEIPSKGIYKDIPDLLYVLLVYITGCNIDGEIRISIDVEDDS